MPLNSYLSEKWNNLTGNLLLRRLLTVLSLDILVKASSIILLPVYLHLMSQEEYGVFNYILSIVYSLSVLLSLGLYIPQSKIFHDYRNDVRRGILFFNIQVILAGSLLFIVIPVYLSGVDYHAVKYLFEKKIDYDRYRFLILMMIITALLSFMLTNFFYTTEKIRYARNYSIWRLLAINLISLLALWLLKGRDTIALRLMVISGVETILLFVFYGVYLRQAVARISSAMIRKCLVMSFPYFLSTFFGIVINFGDKYFLQKHVDYKSLSVYYLAFACAGVISLVSNSLQNVWLPLFFKEKDLAQNIRRTRAMVVRLCLIFVALSVVIWVGLFFVLRWNIISANYEGVLYLVPIQCCSQIILCIALLYSNYMAYLDRSVMVLLAEFIVAIASVALNLWLVPVYKTFGAAFSVLVANLVYLSVYFLLLRYYAGRRLSKIPVQ